MAVTADDLVRREVYYCVSALVSTLAGYTPRMSAYEDARHDRDNKALMDLTAQAQELCAPIDDWEEAAREAGWDETSDGSDGQHVFTDRTDGQTWCANDWRELCEDHDIEPYQREVFEHWIVSDWLAEKLAAKSEKVDTDFAGLTVWARTTTGQGIASDSVIQDIVANLNKPESDA